MTSLPIGRQVSAENMCLERVHDTSGGTTCNLEINMQSARNIQVLGPLQPKEFAKPTKIATTLNLFSFCGMLRYAFLCFPHQWALPQITRNTFWRQAFLFVKPHGRSY